jgi:pSer/pThr/pTyr-binding forkhead associated (FHA) protein
MSPPNNQSWPQQGGFGQQGNMGGFTPPDSDKTVLRPGGSSAGIGYVRVEEGKEPGRTFEVRKEALSIGRSRESDIFLEDLAVSRLHASIVNLGNGNYALKDEGSANGTKVNGQLVNKFQTHPLQEGDRIQLGQTVLVFAQR